MTLSIDELHSLFTSTFVNENHPSIVISRAPGRVNLIGEHIDYNGYGVLPFAISKRVTVVIGLCRESSSSRDKPIMTISNFHDEKYPTRRYFLSENIDEILLAFEEDHHWSHYVLCGYYAALKASERNAFSLKSMNILVHGDVPTSAGLSSSSALVVASCIAVSKLLQFNTTPIQIARSCTEYERMVGTAGGGMDQTIACLAQKDYALYIQFRPSLKAFPVSLPKTQNISFVICDSLSKSSKAITATKYFNKRVLECKLASMIMAKSLQLSNWKEMKSPRSLQDAYFEHKQVNPIATTATGTGGNDLSFINNLKEMQNLVQHELERKKYFTIKEIENLLDVSDIMDLFPKKTEEAMQNVLRILIGDSILSDMSCQLYLWSRLLHVYTEAARVLLVKTSTTCFEIGQLMNESHDSCDVFYDCSCNELNHLVDICRNTKGCLGSRLTGAGWGGCTISMVETDKVDIFMEEVFRKYYCKYIGRNAGERKSTRSQYMFVTCPENGGGVIFDAGTYG